jgi:hypothetical protein
MFNVDFGGSNSSQVPAGKFNIDKEREFSTLYCRPEYLRELKAFLLDVRTMEKREFDGIIKDIEKMQRS